MKPLDDDAVVCQLFEIMFPELIISAKTLSFVEVVSMFFIIFTSREAHSSTLRIM